MIPNVSAACAVTSQTQYAIWNNNTGNNLHRLSSDRNGNQIVVK